MAWHSLPDNYMLPAELAKKMGVGHEFMCNELRLDAGREHKKYPFADAIRNEKTGTWSYRVHRKRFERWENGELDIDMGPPVQPHSGNTAVGQTGTGIF